jgi:FHA domain
MSATCPSGHVSATTDYCDQCGALIEAPPAAVAVAETLPDAVVSDDSLRIPTAASATATPCPECRTPRVADDRFCENCRYDFVAGVATRPDLGQSRSDWTAFVEADRAYFDHQAPDDLAFPEATSPRTVCLDKAEVRIGRGGASSGTGDEVDITGAAGDPAVSRLHAVLERQPDGSYVIRDKSSSNGTTIDELAIAPEEPVALKDGDRVHIGAWTTITIRHQGV